MEVTEYQVNNNDLFYDGGTEYQVNNNYLFYDGGTGVPSEQ
jgi:hypothetical protein